MPQLVIGHTGCDSAWVWVRGGPEARHAVVELEAPDGARLPPKPVELERRRDFTGVARFDGRLDPGQPYTVRARFFARAGGRLRGPALEGTLRTFPEPGEPEAFHFLLGSCNLSTTRLGSLGGFAAGMLGGMAGAGALSRPVEKWDVHYWPGWLPEWAPLKRLLGGAAAWLSAKLPWAILAVTRYVPSGALLPSPFEGLARDIVRQAPEERPAFMIHAGDQIYYDVDFPARAVTAEQYRRNYRQWFDDPCMASVLRQVPHYMTLDDHEIDDGYGTEPDEEQQARLEPAMQAYDDYVASRQPHAEGQRFYRFRHGCADFFVLDTRTGRRPEAGEMLDRDQLAALKAWLADPQARDRLKFVVSSVPFVAQLRPPGVEPDGRRRQSGRADKWSGRAWQGQREEILAAIYEAELDRLVFLTGDMHCAYHATLRLGAPARRWTVHELAGGPIHQLLFARRQDFCERSEGRFLAWAKTEDERELPWVSRLEAFNAAMPNLLRLAVRPPDRERRTPLELEWTVVPTRDQRFATALLGGRIRFPRRPEEPA